MSEPSWAPVLAVSAATVAVAVLLVGVAVVAGYFAMRSDLLPWRRHVVDLRDTAVDPTVLTSGVPPLGPQRYLVTLHLEDGGTDRFTVVTGVDSKKAASIAFEDHRRRLAEGDGRTVHDAPDGSAERTDVQRVQVEHLGPVSRLDDGRLAFDDGDLFDRTEF